MEIFIALLPLEGYELWIKYVIAGFRETRESHVASCTNMAVVIEEIHLQSKGFPSISALSVERALELLGDMK